MLLCACRVSAAKLSDSSSSDGSSGSDDSDSDSESTHDMFNLHNYKKTRADPSPPEVITPSTEAPPSSVSASDPLSVASQPRSHCSFHDEVNDGLDGVITDFLQQPSSHPGREVQSTPSPLEPTSRAPSPDPVPEPPVVQRAPRSRNTDLRSLFEPHSDGGKVWGLSKIRHDVSMESDALDADNTIVQSQSSRDGHASRAHRQDSKESRRSQSNRSQSPPRASSKRGDRKSSQQVSSTGGRSRRESDRKSNSKAAQSSKTERRTSSKSQQQAPVPPPMPQPEVDSKTSKRSRSVKADDDKKSKSKRQKRPPPVSTHLPPAPHSASSIDLNTIMTDSDVACPGELLSPVPSMVQLPRPLARPPANRAAPAPTPGAHVRAEQVPAASTSSKRTKGLSCDTSEIDLFRGVLTIPIKINLSLVPQLDSFLQTASHLHLNDAAAPPQSPSSNPSANTPATRTLDKKAAQQARRDEQLEFATLTGSEKRPLPPLRIPKKSKRPDSLDVATKRRHESPQAHDDGRKRRRHHRDRRDASPGQLPRYASTGFATDRTTAEHTE